MTSVPLTVTLIRPVTMHALQYNTRRGFELKLKTTVVSNLENVSNMGRYYYVISHLWSRSVCFQRLS